MPKTTIPTDNIFADHEKRIRELERKVRLLSSPAMSSIAVISTNDVDDLELYDGNFFISKDSSPTIIYVVGGVSYALSGSPV